MKTVMKYVIVLLLATILSCKSQYQDPCWSKDDWRDIVFQTDDVAQLTRRAKGAVINDTSVTITVYALPDSVLQITARKTDDSLGLTCSSTSFRLSREYRAEVYVARNGSVKLQCVWYTLLDRFDDQEIGLIEIGYQGKVPINGPFRHPTKIKFMNIEVNDKNVLNDQPGYIHLER